VHGTPYAVFAWLPPGPDQVEGRPCARASFRGYVFASGFVVSVCSVVSVAKRI